MLYIIKHSKFPDILIWFLGGLDGLLLSLIIIVIIECISSMLSSLFLYKFSLESTVRWILNKCMLFLLIGTVNTIDAFLIRNGEGIRAITLWFYIAYECIIVLENSAILGLPIPTKLINFVYGILKHISKNNSDDENDL